MNFITDLPLSKKSSEMFDFILMMINQYTKMTQYIFIKITLKVHELSKIFMKKIFLCDYDVFLDIISNRDMLFISAY